MSWMQSFAEREAALLAPYAVKSVDSQGRKFPEPCQEYRSLPQQGQNDVWRVAHAGKCKRDLGEDSVASALQLLRLTAAADECISTLSGSGRMHHPAPLG